MNNQFNEFSALTHNVLVRVKPVFYPDASNRLYSIYVWLYNVKIENLGEYPIQLLRRYWKIYDSNSTIEEISGDGVVGQQPTLNPMEVFDYSSQARLFTTSGLMQGEYTMLNKVSMKEFKVIVPMFSLDIDPINYKFKN